MSEANKELLRRWFAEVWSAGRTDAIDEMFAADGVAYGLSGETGEAMRGPEDFKTYHAQMRTAFPDVTVVIDDILAEGDCVAARCTVRGNHRGDSLGVAPTNFPVDFTGMCFVRIEDGKIAEAWNNFDFMRMYRQVGLL